MSDERPKCGLCGHPMPEGEEMFKYHGYSGPCPGPPKIMSVEEINASCDVGGHVLLPEGSQCGICGVQVTDMVRITRSVWDAIRKDLDDTRDQLADLRQTHNGILAMIGTGDDPTYDELQARLAEAEKKYDELKHVVECNKRLLIENDGLRLSLAAAEATRDKERNRALGLLDLVEQCENNERDVRHDLAECRRLLREACVAWDNGLCVSNSDGLVMADYRAAVMSREWYEAAKAGGRDE